MADVGKIGITVDGAFDAAKDYEKQTIVTYGNASFISIAQTGGALPTDDTKWLKLCEGSIGSMWYKGTGITGTSITPTVFSGSGVENAHSNDMYINSSTGSIYQCNTGGIPTAATWIFVMTLSGGGGGASSWDDLPDKPFDDVGTDGLKVDSDTLDVDFTKVQRPLADVSETASEIADTDYLLVGAKKTLWATIKSVLKTYFDTLYNLYTHPTGDGNLHVPATGTTNSGKVLKAGATEGSMSWESESGGGHEMIDDIDDLMTDTTNTKVVSNGVVKEINSNLTANTNPFVFDYQNGSYGYNTSAARGADTFHPFSSSNLELLYSVANDTTPYPNNFGEFYPSLTKTINSGNHTKLMIFVGGYCGQSSNTYININGTNIVSKNNTGYYGIVLGEFDTDTNTDYALLVGGAVSTCECMVYGC